MHVIYMICYKRRLITLFFIFLHINIKPKEICTYALINLYIYKLIRAYVFIIYVYL